MVPDNKKGKTGKRKEMTIVLKSKPLSSDSARHAQFATKSESKPRGVRKKGTRGPSWIG